MASNLEDTASESERVRVAAELLRLPPHLVLEFMKKQHFEEPQVVQTATQQEQDEEVVRQAQPQAGEESGQEFLLGEEDYPGGNGLHLLPETGLAWDGFAGPPGFPGLDLASYPSIYEAMGSLQQFENSNQAIQQPLLPEANHPPYLQPVKQLASAVFSSSGSPPSETSIALVRSGGSDLHGNLLPSSGQQYGFQDVFPFDKERIIPVAGNNEPTATFSDFWEPEMVSSHPATMRMAVSDPLVALVENDLGRGFGLYDEILPQVTHSTARRSPSHLATSREPSDIPSTGFAGPVVSEGNCHAPISENLEFATSTTSSAPAATINERAGHNSILAPLASVVEKPVKTPEYSMGDPAIYNTGIAHFALARPRLASKPAMDQRQTILLNEGVERTVNEQAKKHRRAPYSKEQRLETHKARQMVSCVRCHTQRIRCVPNPLGDHLPCVKCSALNPRTFFLGCLRHKITDSVLFRTNVGPYTFYQRHPMVGEAYGDFSLQSARRWVGDQIHVLEITQDMGPVCRLEVRQFEPPVEPDALDLKGRSMYYVPWAIADSDQATRALNIFLDECMVLYLNNVLDESDELVWVVLHSAITYAFKSGHQEANLIKDALRLWVACRFIEGKWRCCGRDTLGSEQLKNPFRSGDWVSPPPYIDYQFASVILQRILDPLRKSVLRSLQNLVDENKPKNWYTIFLVSFILLHNYERGVTFQRAFWAKRKANLKYLDMSLIRAIHSGAKAILAYFHWSCKGNVPFGANFDWNSKAAQKMANINAEQAAAMVELGQMARQKAADMQNVNRSHDYETPYWFTSQIFEERWTARETMEHSPPMKPWPPLPVFGPSRASVVG